MATLWHFTCDHGRKGIGRAGLVQPNRAVVPSLAWFTDLANPVREELGLTSLILNCDRMAHRYRVIGSGDVIPWASADVPNDLRRALESAEGASPEHWFVSYRPVPVKLDWRAV